MSIPDFFSNNIYNYFRSLKIRFMFDPNSNYSTSKKIQVATSKSQSVATGPKIQVATSQSQSAATNPSLPSSSSSESILISHAPAPSQKVATSSTYDPKFHIKNSNFNPPSELFSPNLDKYIRLTEATFKSYTSQFYNHFLKKQIQPFPTPHRNFSTNQMIFYNELKNNKSIIIKPSDKNLGFTAVNTTWYHTEMMKQLSDKKTYQIIPSNELKFIIINLRDEFNAIINSKSYSHLFSSSHKLFFSSKMKDENVSIPGIYLLPKIHKTPMTGRPIVPSYAWVTTPASIWLDDQLQPIAKIPHVLTDSLSLIRVLESTSYTAPEKLQLTGNPVATANPIFITADISSLYTNIPTNEGLIKFKSFLQLKMVDITLINLYVRLLTMVLNNNYFEYKKVLYKQINGTAMGTSVAVIYANIFVYMIEYETINIFSFSIFLYRRYLDDLFFIVHSKDQCKKLIDALSSLHDSIEFTFSISEDRAEFLDVVIYKGERYHTTKLFDTSVHQKSMNQYLYFPYSSYHTRHTKIGLITTELIRYIRITSSFSVYLSLKLRFFHRLRARGYPKKFLKFCFNKTLYSSRSFYLADKLQLAASTTLTDDQKLKLQLRQQKLQLQPSVFLTTYTPLCDILPIKQILLKHWSIIQNDPILNMVFPSEPIVGYRMATTLLELIASKRSNSLG